MLNEQKLEGSLSGEAAIICGAWGSGYAAVALTLALERTGDAKRGRAAHAAGGKSVSLEHLGPERHATAAPCLASVGGGYVNGIGLVVDGDLACTALQFMGVGS